MARADLRREYPVIRYASYQSDDFDASLTIEKKSVASKKSCTNKKRRALSRPPLLI